MKRFVTTLLVGASLAALAVGGARAELFTITRTITPTTTITETLGGSSISVNFLNSGIESPQAECSPPGTSVTLLNYTVTHAGAPGNVNFANVPFQLDVLWDNGTNTHTSTFLGTVNGSANATQDNLVITLNPTPGAMQFSMGPLVEYTVYDLQSTLPPIVNDVDNPGAVSAQVVCNVIPEPGSMALLGTALLPILGLARRRRK